MSRKTYSLSAVAIVAMAGLSFSSADSAEALAQDGVVEMAASGEASTEEVVEIVPEQSVFVSEEVVQPLPEASARPVASAASLSEPVAAIDSDQELTEQLHCLAGAVYFESRGEPLDGQLAVAQVIINRAEDSRWPSSYCSVVHQRSQFSFVKNGRMPHIRTSSGAWQRAQAIARIAHRGLWDSSAREAVYFHAKYVRPGWSRRKVAVATIDTHVFYR